MPELYARAIKKWIVSLNGNIPTLDFHNGVRVRDIAIDTSVYPNKIWVCYENTIGSPVWVQEDHPVSVRLYDNAANTVIVGNVNDKSIIISYLIHGVLFHQDGVIKISVVNGEISFSDEFSGRNPVFDMNIYANMVNNKITLYFDMRSGVGEDLLLEYNIINRI